MDILAIISTHLGTALTGLVGSGLWRQYQQHSHQAKAKRFITKLHGSLRAYSEKKPVDDEEAMTRQEVVQQRVRELSGEVFGEEVPQIESMRPEDAEYPEIDCRWCHRPHRPLPGARGDCRNCRLPLDVWMACQAEGCSSSGPGETQAEKGADLPEPS
ncbi:MAG: hypothetical protein AAFX50_25735 [Acidobacteriota bacterium]